MKKLISTITLAATILLGVTSCNNNDTTQHFDESKTGGLKLSFDFTKPLGTKATTASDAKPSTSWNTNIKSLVILFVDPGTSIVKDVRDVPLSTSTALTAETRVFSNIIAGNYTAYVIANSNLNGIASKLTTQTGASWDATTVKGKNINDLLMSLIPYSTWAAEKSATTESTAVAYGEAGEIFLATVTGINVIADQNNDYTATKPFSLTRAVSLFRARINPTDVNKTVINFADVNASIRIRRAGTYVNPLGTVFPATPSGDNLVFAKQFSTSSAMPAGYTGTTILDATQTAWKDIRIFPGGSGIANNPTAGTNSKKFEVVICGITTASYTTLSGTTVPSGTKIYWQGTVNGDIAANKILEVNMILNSKGETEIPGTQTTGNLSITVGLVDWGAISSTELPM